MRTNFSQTTLLLVQSVIPTHGAMIELSRKSGVDYHKLRRWAKGATKDMSAEDVQAIYETLTGKQLEY